MIAHILQVYFSLGVRCGVATVLSCQMNNTKSFIYANIARAVFLQGITHEKCSRFAWLFCLKVNSEKYQPKKWYLTYLTVYMQAYLSLALALRGCFRDTFVFCGRHRPSADWAEHSYRIVRQLYATIYQINDNNIGNRLLLREEDVNRLEQTVPKSVRETGLSQTMHCTYLQTLLFLCLLAKLICIGATLLHCQRRTFFRQLL